MLEEYDKNQKMLSRLGIDKNTSDQLKTMFAVYNQLARGLSTLKKDQLDTLWRETQPKSQFAKTGHPSPTTRKLLNQFGLEIYQLNWYLSQYQTAKKQTKFNARRLDNTARKLQAIELKKLQAKLSKIIRDMKPSHQKSTTKAPRHNIIRRRLGGFFGNFTKRLTNATLRAARQYPRHLRRIENSKQQHHHHDRDLSSIDR